MRKLRVLLLLNQYSVPPENFKELTDKQKQDFKTEIDVIKGLRNLGHEVRPLGILSDLGVIRKAIEDWKPHINFNLMEEFHGVAIYDQNVVSYLELMKKTYTGCNPRGLMIARDKALSKKILSYHRIRVPNFGVFPVGKVGSLPKRLTYPVLVKSLVEEASLGISQASIVQSDEKLKERIKFIHEQFSTDAIVEEYIDGRELYVGVIGNRRLKTFPIWEMVFQKMPDEIAKIATHRVKWNRNYQKKYGIDSYMAEKLPSEVEKKLPALCKRIYKILNLSGYARIDLRLTKEGKVYVLEANPNPDLAKIEDFAASAKKAGLSYENLLKRIINYGMQYHAAWKNYD